MRQFPPEGPRVLWTVSAGQGYGGASIHNGEVFFLDRIDEQQDILRCLDLETGEEKWRYAYDAPGSTGHSGSRTPPTVDATHVFSVGLMGDFLCVDRATRRPVWRRNLLRDYGLDTPRWGVSQAPVLYRDWVIVAPQADDAFVVAYNRHTGEPVWKSPGLGGVGYSSPLITRLCGVDQVVMISAPSGRTSSRVTGLSVEDGSVLWSYDGWRCRIPIPHALPLPDDRLFITGGYNSGSVMLQVTRDNDQFAVKELFTLDMATCGSQIHQPLFFRDHLYVNSNSNEREDGMICLTLDGEVLWRTTDTPGQPVFERGGFILADDMIIALDGEAGTLHLIDPLPQGYKERSRAQVIEGSRMWTPLALSRGRLLIRNQDTMKCLDLRAP